MNTEVHELLTAAGKDAKQGYEDNEDREPGFRASRAGLSLLQLVAQDYIFPALPKTERKEYTAAASTGRSITSDMNLGIGYLFEQAAIKSLLSNYPEYELHAQMRLTYHGISGTADIILMNRKAKKAIVIECKALGVSTLKEAVANKLEVDNWGYLSQLAVYKKAVEAISGFETEAYWYLWAKKANKFFSYKLKPGVADIAAGDAVKRCEAYNSFQKAFNDKLIADCVSVVMQALSEGDEPPARQPFYAGVAASCGWHYDFWQALFVDEDGLLYEDVASRLATALSFVFDPTEDNKKKVYKMLDNSDYIAV